MEVSVNKHYINHCLSCIMKEQHKIGLVLLGVISASVISYYFYTGKAAPKKLDTIQESSDEEDEKDKTE